MNIIRLYNRAVFSICAVRAAKRCRKATARLHKMVPELAEQSAMFNAARKAHKITRDHERRMRAITNGLLGG